MRAAVSQLLHALHNKQLRGEPPFSNRQWRDALRYRGPASEDPLPLAAPAATAADAQQGAHSPPCSPRGRSCADDDSNGSDDEHGDSTREYAALLATMETDVMGLSVGAAGGGDSNDGQFNDLLIVLNRSLTPVLRAIARHFHRTGTLNNAATPAVFG